MKSWLQLQCAQPQIVLEAFADAFISRWEPPRRRGGDVGDAGMELADGNALRWFGITTQREAQCDVGSLSLNLARLHWISVCPELDENDTNARCNPRDCGDPLYLLWSCNI
jgi:hypothetical protein